MATKKSVKPADRERPSKGGRYIRDKSTGKLNPVDKPNAPEEKEPS